MVDIDKLATFLRAAETLSFSETAKQLHMSQPSVSHHIKILEQEMGAVLFNRTNTGIELTEAGRLLLPWARRLLHDTNSMQAMMASMQGAVVGELRICSDHLGEGAHLAIPLVLIGLQAAFHIHQTAFMQILLAVFTCEFLRCCEAERTAGIEPA